MSARIVDDHHDRHTGNEISLILGAIGVVFGDIGTSPLYALKLSVEAASGGAAGDSINPAVLGVLSLMTWALLIVVTLKYVMLIMRADNNGEGGVFALAALILKRARNNSRAGWAVTIAGTIGAALFFGDSMITPAISVLSAVEGLNVIAPSLKAYVLHITVVLIVGLFAVERLGTAKVGAVFGPIMLVWFSALGLLGAAEITSNPSVLQALSPGVGLQFLMHRPGIAVAILGAVVLAVTGGEALYADMGHFGRVPIQKAWLLLVFPALLLNYFGQGALLLRDPTALDNPFYRLAPDWAQIPLLLLAFLATIIASQAVISGAFSIAKQAVHLGYLPRLRIRHTSEDEIGQVYVSKVNIVLFVGVVGLVLGFRNSESLASAYGISVIGAMAIDTVLAGIYFIVVKSWSKVVFAPIFLALLVIDLMFLGANLFKFFEGGWLPVAVALVTLTFMISWTIGRNRLLAARWQDAMKLDAFLNSIVGHPPLRVPGTAIFMVPLDNIVPIALLHNLKHNKVLHERILFLRVQSEDVPYVRDVDRVEMVHHELNFHTAVVKYGYMEDPNIPRVLALLRVREFHFSMMEISIFVGKEKVITKSSSPLIGLFILIHRAMLGATEYFRIPPGHVVELGGHIEI